MHGGMCVPLGEEGVAGRGRGSVYMHHDFGVCTLREYLGCLISYFKQKRRMKNA